MAVKKKTWTTEDNERLKALVAKDASIVKVAAELGRTTRSLRVQARKLGTPFPRMKDYRKKFQVGPVSAWRQY
jgi:transposase-like protein